MGNESKRETGVFLHMAADELAKHCLTRAEYHRGRANVYLKRADELTKDRREAPNPNFDGDDEVGYGKFGNSSSQNDPVAQMHRDAAMHRGKAERFRFIASHVIPDETYTLTILELPALEIGA